MRGKMAALETLSGNSSAQSIIKVIERDGAAIVADMADPATIEQMRSELHPYIERTPMGGDDFTGRSTQRTGALVARTPTCRDFVLNEQILATANGFLGRFTDRIILHLTQTIYIHPGQGKQVLHRDRLAWGKHIPLDIEPQLNTIWALTDFTSANGATRIVPGSQSWDWERRAEPEEMCQAEMPAGSVLLYTGSVLHSGGANEANDSRLGLNITYCLGWLRQEENQYLSCPPHIAKDLAPELQELLGYTQGNYALGYFSDPESTEPNRDILPPEMALGRKPRKSMGFSISEATDEGIDREDPKLKVRDDQI